MNEQPAYVTREEFERRMRVLEGEVGGEKAVTRHILEQTHRNGDELLAMRSELAAVRSELAGVKSRVDHLAGDVVLIKSELATHTALLNVLVQDVALVRNALAPRDPGTGT